MIKHFQGDIVDSEEGKVLSALEAQAKEVAEQERLLKKRARKYKAENTSKYDARTLLRAGFHSCVLLQCLTTAKIYRHGGKTLKSGGLMAWM